MLTIHVALVSEVPAISSSELSATSAALQKQVTRDFGPLWDIQATVDSFPRLEDVPADYWPIIVQQDIHTPGARGIHNDKNGQPFSLIAYNFTWSLTASHECLEMLADASGNRLIAGQSPKSDQGHVEFLVEVCDPVGSLESTYTVNDVLVADFITPHYFDPQLAVGVRYNFMGTMKGPRQVAQGGYLTWHEPITGHWWQLRFFGAEQQFIDLGVQAPAGACLRTMIDALTPPPGIMTVPSADHPHIQKVTAKQKTVRETSHAKALSLRKQIEALIK